MEYSFNTLYKAGSERETCQLALDWLYQELKAEHCFVAHLDNSHRMVHTSIYQKSGQVVDNISYPLAHTPCKAAYHAHEVCEFYGDLESQFPKDEILHGMGAQAYLGITLKDVSHRPVGLLVAVFCHKPQISEDARKLFHDIAFVLGAQISHSREKVAKNDLLSELSLRNAVFGSSKDAIVICDSSNRIIRVNKAFEKYTGYKEHEVIGGNPNILASGRHDKAFYQHLWHELKKRDHWRGEIYNRRKNGEIYPEELSITVHRNFRGELRNYIAVFRDISKWKKLEQKLRFYASQEPLTGLYNRRSFMDKVEQSLGQYQQRLTPIAVVFINLDRFNDINDLYGPEVGDKVLVTVALRLQNCIDNADIISRYAGDEFGVLIKDKDDSAVLEQVQRMQQHLAQPMRFDQIKVELTASIGIASMNPEVESSSVLVRHASHAMVAAKRSGYAQVCIHNDYIEGQYQRKLLLRDKLKRLLTSRGLQVNYQPIIDNKSHKVVRFEALSRWYDDELGHISPGEFINIAQEFGLINSLGNFVLNKALHDLKVMHEHGFDDLGMTVNRSGSEFNDQQAHSSVIDALKVSGIDAQHLTIEVTESVAINAGDKVESVLTRLREKGVKVALDDFCTGYSSLSHLIDFQTDYIKIDRAFTNKICTDDKHRTIVEAIIKVASQLGMKVIAEGVETQAQQQMLQQMGCHYSQGYYFSAALPLKEAISFLKKPSPVADNKELARL